MIIIAETKEGFLISAQSDEVKEILRAVNGTTPVIVEIGQKLPAIDYAGTITKIKNLQNNNHWIGILNRFEGLKREMEAMQEVVDGAANID